MAEDGGGNQAALAAPVQEQETKKYAGKYDTPEALETAYKALETKLGSQQTKPKPSSDPNDIMAATPNTPTEFSSYDDLVKSTGYETTNLYKKWSGGEDLDDFYAKASKRLGVSKSLAKEITDTKLGAFKARNDAAMKTAVDAAGGQDQFDALRNFMGTLDPSEQSEYRAAVNNPATTKFGIQSLVERYNHSIGADGGGKLAGGRPPSAVGGGFSNFNDYAAALKLKSQGRADQGTLAKIKNTPESVIDLVNRPG